MAELMRLLASAMPRYLRRGVKQYNHMKNKENDSFNLYDSTALKEDLYRVLLDGR